MVHAVAKDRKGKRSHDLRGGVDHAVESGDLRLAGGAIVNLDQVYDLGRVIIGGPLVVVPVGGRVRKFGIAGLALAVDDILILGVVECSDEIGKRAQQGVSLSDCLVDRKGEEHSVNGPDAIGSCYSSTARGGRCSIVRCCEVTADVISRPGLEIRKYDRSGLTSLHVDGARSFVSWIVVDVVQEIRL